MAYPYYPAVQPAYYPSYPQTFQPTQTGILWVDSYDDALKFPLAPNNAVRLWHRTQPVVFFKESDSSGRISIKAYDLVERTESPSESVSHDSDKLPDYATKSELEEIFATITAMKTDIDTIKGDMYGVVGKKRAKKQEVTEDDE
jgi:hypothetical protein